MNTEIDLWAGRIAALKQEWKQIHKEELAQQAEATQRTLDRWYRTIAEMKQLEQIYRRANLWLSGPCNLLSVIGRAREETCHTAILAWLLNPTAPHGLGDRFLRRLFQRCFSDEPALWRKSSLGAATTATDVPAATSRADIVVRTPTVRVVIGAKIDSVECDRQCERLYRDFSAIGDVIPARFVFLSPRGQRPRTEGDEVRDVFEQWSFRDIRDDLRALIGELVVPRAQPMAVAGFAAVIDYLSVLEEEFI